jgi:hypothetical protein
VEVLEAAAVLVMPRATLLTCCPWFSPAGSGMWAAVATVKP